MNKKWQILPQPPKEFFNQFPEHPPLLLSFLYHRNIRSQKQIDEFLNPDYEEDILNPFLMKGMNETIDRILKAILNEEKIVVYGDYDADGICASVILIKTFRKIAEVLSKKDCTSCYIPDRKTEGYSLNKKAIEEFKKDGIKLIITVDCGITNFEEVELAKNLGIDLIIVDHHNVLEKIPLAYSIIDPKQKNDQYPFKQLSGAGVAFKLVQALLITINKQKQLIDRSFEKWLLDLVAIATVADVCPLISENRTLVKYGLIVLNKTKNLGLQALIQKVKINEINTWNIAFQIGPRLNSSGRMDHADKAFYLLMTESPTEAEKLAEEIEEKNKQRQNLIDKLYQEIKEKILTLAPEKKILIFSSENYPGGIIGLLAGKIKDEFFRPAIIIEEKEEKAKGSCRSIDEFNLVEVLKKCEDILERFGGHPKAAGFSLKKEKIPEFKKRLEEIADFELKDKELLPKIIIETKIKAEEITWLMDEQIKLLEPLGEANQEPLFLMEDLEIKNFQGVGNNEKHLRLELFSPSSREAVNFSFKAIAFDQGKEIEKIKIGNKLDVVFSLAVDEWNNRKQLQLKIIDFKLKYKAEK